MWNFDAFAATMFGQPPMQPAHLLWLIRQLQVRGRVWGEGPR